MTVLQYFIIGLILCVIFLVLYIIDRKKDCIGIIDILDIDDETSLGMFLFVTLILWPLELIILGVILLTNPILCPPSTHLNLKEDLV